MENNKTDIQLVDEFIEKCSRFINPKLFREIEKRGLYDIVNMLPHNIDEAKVVARARLSKSNKFFNDEEITQISNEIERMYFLRNELQSMNIADVDKYIPLLNEWKNRAEFIKNYYKTPKIINQ